MESAVGSDRLKWQFAPSRVWCIVLSFVVGSLTGCSAPVVHEIHDEARIESEQGYLVMRWRAVNKGLRGDEVPDVRCLLTEGKYGQRGVSLAPKTKDDLQVYVLPAGEYRCGSLLWNRSLRLGVGMRVRVFTVEKGKATYIGVYNFVFNLKKNLFGLDVLDSFEFDYLNDLSAVRGRITDRLKGVVLSPGREIDVQFQPSFQWPAER